MAQKKSENVGLDPTVWSGMHFAPSAAFWAWLEEYRPLAAKILKRHVDPELHISRSSAQSIVTPVRDIQLTAEESRQFNHTDPPGGWAIYVPKAPSDSLLGLPVVEAVEKEPGMGELALYYPVHQLRFDLVRRDRTFWSVTTRTCLFRGPWRFEDTFTLPQMLIGGVGSVDIVYVGDDGKFEFTTALSSIRTTDVSLPACLALQENTYEPSDHH